MTTKRIVVDLDDTEQAEMQGALNWYKDNPGELPRKFVLSQKSRERIVAIGAQFGIDVYPGAAPPPTPINPADSIRFRATHFGKWAAWRLASMPELVAMRAEFGDLLVSQLDNFYGESGGGGLSVQGHMGSDGIPEFFALVDGVEVLTKDVGGAADAYVLKMATAQSRTVPGSPI